VKNAPILGEKRVKNAALECEKMGRKWPEFPYFYLRKALFDNDLRLFSQIFTKIGSAYCNLSIIDYIGCSWLID